MKNPLVSVIIITFNRAHLISRAIESVLNQTFKDFELIIVDDGSIDNTKEIVENFQKKDKRIKYIKHNENRGGNSARNTGVKNSKGEYIAFLDSDDRWLESNLEKKLEVFKNSKEKNLGFVYSGVSSIKNDKKFLEYFPKKRGNSYNIILKNSFIKSGSNNLIKKECFKRCGLFDESDKLKKGGFQECEMWMRIAKKYSFDFTEERLVEYYVHNDIITKKTTDILKLEAELYILNKNKNYYKENHKEYSDKLNNIGAKYILTKKKNIGRGFLLKSIICNIFQAKSYSYLLVSFFPLKFFSYFYQCYSNNIGNENDKNKKGLEFKYNLFIYYIIRPFSAFFTVFFFYLDINQMTIILFKLFLEILGIILFIYNYFFIGLTFIILGRIFNYININDKKSSWIELVKELTEIASYIFLWIVISFLFYQKNDFKYLFLALFIPILKLLSILFLNRVEIYIKEIVEREKDKSKKVSLELEKDNFKERNKEKYLFYFFEKINYYLSFLLRILFLPLLFFSVFFESFYFIAILFFFLNGIIFINNLLIEFLKNRLILKNYPL